MSQIPHSQLALKKRITPVVELRRVNVNGSSNGHSKNEDKNGHMNKNNDKEVIIIDDDYQTIPVGREEVIEEVVSDISPKKKRGRKPKSSTDSRESTEVSTIETPKQDKIVADDMNDEISEEILKHVFAEDFTPEASPKETKILKMSTESLASANKRRSDRLQNASTIVNLSSVSTTTDQSTKESNDTLIADDEMSSNTTTERRVSGRRSTRPIDDIKYSYRSTNADDSLNATTDATIGSEIADSMIETPAHERKRRFESMENIESPKRSRLDLSALFSNFSSPVALLRNRFRKANLASTPKVGENLEDSVNSIDSSASEMKEIDLNEKSDEIVSIEAATVGGENAQVIEKSTKKNLCLIM